MGGRGLILAIVTVVAALAVACGASSQDADEPAPASDASPNVAQAAPTPYLDTPSGTGETAASAQSLPAPEPTQPANTPTPSATDAAEGQVGLDSDINPPDPLNRDTGRRIIRFSQPDGDGTKERTLEIHSILPRDAIPAIDNPVFITAEEALENLVDRDLVIGVSVNGEHKAYSTAFLSSHEVVNDVIGGKPVAVTW